MGSKSAKLLKEGLIVEGIKCFRKRVTDVFIPRKDDLIIYYGGIDRLYHQEHLTINANRELAQNKLRAFEAFKADNLSTVEWTTSKEMAATWPLAIARATLTGHSGKGITIHEQGQDLPDVRLYTKYMKKTYECRVHVFNGKVIDAQIKRKRTTDEPEETNTYIRNIHTGWVYCRKDFTLPEAAVELSLAAINAVGLDFGAVDLIYNQHYNKFYILEVNTAPGLEGTTLTNYIQEIKHDL